MSQPNSSGRRQFFANLTRQAAAVSLLAFGVNEARKRRRLAGSSDCWVVETCDDCFLLSMCGRAKPSKVGGSEPPEAKAPSATK